MARAYLQEANLPRKFWFWALRMAFERMCLIPMEVGKEEDGSPTLATPFELFYKRKPDLRVLFPFGCVGYFSRETDHIRDTTGKSKPVQRTKFQAQTLSGIALGRSAHSNAMMFWSPETSRFSVSADYKLDPDKQVQNHWPELLNDGGFILQYVSHSSDTSTDSPIKIGDAVVFQPE
jgi:hypothetical protein